MKKNIYIFIFTIVITSVIIYLSIDKNYKIENLSNKIKKEHKYQVDASVLAFKSYTEMIINSMINKNEILKLQSYALNTKDSNERDKYRAELLNRLNPVFEELKKLELKQLQFNFPDTTSFLRLHKPNKFGDNLKDIRHSIVKANTELVKVYGFEEGRLFHGYRFVYPIFYNGQHIGSTEISLGFNAIDKISKEVYNTHQHIILNKHIIHEKLFSAERKKYEISSISENFYQEINKSFHHKEEFNLPHKDIPLDVFNEINEHFKSDVDIDILDKYIPIVKFLTIQSNHYYVSLLPINNIKKENIGYIISYNKSDEYTNILQEYQDKLLIYSVILIMLFAFIYRMARNREELKRYNNTIYIQRNKAMAASKAKSEFLANMSHEIRTPLNAIHGFIELLKEENTGRKSLAYVNVIDSASKNLLQIIEDILDFSKIENGKLEIEYIDFNTKDEFQVMTDLFDMRCSQKNINLTLVLDKNLPEALNGDPLRIKQVIANLLSNAIKFTENSKKIKVSIAYRDGMLYVSVEDEGKGISEDKLKHIFKSFSQEDNSTTRKYGGTGLGLSISKELVHLMGGELKVNSKLGVGSEFYFSIPLKIGVTTDTKKEDKDTDNRNLSGKILVVEDNKTNQQFMKVLLMDMGLEYTVANDGLEAVEKFKTGKYDVILMDENMPNMSGIEATSHILEFEKSKNLKHTPIIALTANAIKGDKERFLSAGMDDYLAKPLQIKKLLSVLNKYLSKS